MKLDAYRREKGWSLDRLASVLGIEGKNAARTVHRYEAGTRIPRPDQMARIVAATEGKVQPGDFYPLHDQPAPQPEAAGT